MLYVLDKFRICRDMDFEHQGAIVGLMKDVVTYLKKDKIPYEKYSMDDLKGYINSLIELQRSEEIVKGSWAVAPEPENTPEDEIVEFHYFPTYLGVAAMSLFKLKYPEEAKTIDGFDKALLEGMKFSVKNSFNGYGFNSDFQRLEAAILLSMGDTPVLLKNNPELCPELLAELISVRNEVVKAVENKKLVNDFGINLGNEYKAVLLGLNVLKDL